MFDPDLINLPPMRYRPIWLITDNDDTDTNYSADEGDQELDSRSGVKGDKMDKEREDGSVPIPREDYEGLKEIERPRKDGEHTGVG